MAYCLEKTKKQIVNLINKALGSKIILASNLIYPPNSDLGDISLPCFSESTLGMSAEDLFKRLSKQPDTGLKISLAGKFLNFKLDKR